MGLLQTLLEDSTSGQKESAVQRTGDIAGDGEAFDRLTRHEAKGLAKMTNNTDDLIYLPDGVECPAGRVTFGAMIEEAVADFVAKAKLTEAEANHVERYKAWKSAQLWKLRAIYPQGHPIERDIRYYEWHISHFLIYTENDACVQWFFNNISDEDRRELAELTRAGTDGNR